MFSRKEGNYCDWKRKKRRNTNNFRFLRDYFNLKKLSLNNNIIFSLFSASPSKIFAFSVKNSFQSTLFRRKTYCESSLFSTISHKTSRKPYKSLDFSIFSQRTGFSAQFPGKSVRNSWIFSISRQILTKVSSFASFFEKSPKSDVESSFFPNSR